MATATLLLWALPVLAAPGAQDPRVELVELQLAERWEAALDRTEAALAEDPAGAERLWLRYLRADLLERLGRYHEANAEFSRLLSADSDLADFSRMRMAELQDALGHPEVAAGLVATLLGRGAPVEIASRATDLLVRTLAEGADCRLLGRMSSWRIEPSDRRQLRLAAAECRLRQGATEEGATLLLELLLESTDDLVARHAADQLARLGPSRERGPQTEIAIGLAFHHNREFQHAIDHLEAGLDALDPERLTLSPAEVAEYRYAVARAHFWLGDYAEAAAQFHQLAETGDDAETVARALYQEGRCRELSGAWTEAAPTFRRAYLAQPEGDWAAAALLSTLRLDFRSGREGQAEEILATLDSRPGWAGAARRAALYMASSDIVRGRPERARIWLERPPGDDAEEFLYWRGRLAELEGDPAQAVRLYTALLVRDNHHPLAGWARQRLAGSDLAETAEVAAQQLAATGSREGLYSAWLLEGDDSPLGAAARERLRQRLLADRRSRPFLDMRTLPPRSWPLWRAPLQRTSERFLALGQWRLGQPAIGEYFPYDEPSLAFTASAILGRSGYHRRSLYIAEVLAQQVPSWVPEDLLPKPFRVILHPYPYRALITAAAQRQGVDPHLLAALIREESRFDPQAVSAVSARGLTQFVYPTAQQMADRLDVRLDSPATLHDPAVSITLGAAYLAELERRFGGREEAAITAYNAGPDQARLWTSYCFGRDAAEYFSKVGFSETRHYLRKVLTSRANYLALYGRI